MKRKERYFDTSPGPFNALWAMFRAITFGLVYLARENGKDAFKTKKDGKPPFSHEGMIEEGYKPMADGPTALERVSIQAENKAKRKRYQELARVIRKLMLRLRIMRRLLFLTTATSSFGYFATALRIASRSSAVCRKNFGRMTVSIPSLIPRVTSTVFIRP